MLLTLTFNLEELCAPTQAELDNKREWADRAWATMMLATTVETWQALMRGDPVDETTLDQFWLRRFRKQGVVDQ